MDQILTFWPIVTGVVVIVGGVSGLFVALLRIKQLRLSIEKLEQEIRESRDYIHRPSIEEIEKYGKALEQIVRKSEYSYRRQVELTKSFHAEAKEQQEALAQLEHSFQGFEAAIYHTRTLRKELHSLAKALNGFSEDR